MGMGIDFPKIVDQTFFTKTYEQNRIMGLALVKSKLHLDGKCISSIITAEEMREYNVLPKHLDGIVSQLRVTKDVEAAVFYTRQMKKIIKSAPVQQVMWMLQRSQQNMAVADMSGQQVFPWREIRKNG